MDVNILVVDDEKNIRSGIADALSLEQYKVLEASDGQEAVDILAVEDIDIVISDLKMPRMSGEKLLKRILQNYPLIPVIILTGFGSVEVAVQAMQNGAYDFATKPINLERLSLIIRRALAFRKTIRENQILQHELTQQKSEHTIIGKSSHMQQILASIQQIAPTRAAVLITGESGVGKEEVANALHMQSPRKNDPFIKVHCAALSEHLLESELFGHEKGAFTGAIQQKKGRFELADGGTIFLDEIGEIDQNTQIKILRVLQEKAFERVGGEKTLNVDVRVISATNRNLHEEIQTGQFREDLFYRLNVVHINVPPLRERREDIPLLTAHFLAICAQENKKNIEGIDYKARKLLEEYHWPGNIRELRNCVESAVVLCKGSVIESDDLPAHIHRDLENSTIKLQIGSTLADAEREMIRGTLRAQSGNKSRTAEILGIGRKTLHKKINDYHLD